MMLIVKGMNPAPYKLTAVSLTHVKGRRHAEQFYAGWCQMMSHQGGEPCPY